MSSFNASERKELLLAMKLMREADSTNNPLGKLTFDKIYNSLNISDDEGLSILNYFKEAHIDLKSSLEKHFSIISNWSLEKRKDLISILTIMATIDKNLEKSEHNIITLYRIRCGLDYNDFSLVAAMKNAQKYILK